MEKLRKIRDNKRAFAAVFTDLSKVFECISHEVLVAYKLKAYKSDIKSLNFILAYLTNWKQKTKISSSFSDFLNILFGAPKGSTLGPHHSALLVKRNSSTIHQGNLQLLTKEIFKIKMNISREIMNKYFIF